MSRLFAAIAFLTRAPLPARWRFDAADVGRATLFFPLVGAGLGLAQAGLLRLLALVANFGGPAGVVPPLVAAALVVAAGVWLTGAMHLDGLADVADGFGGGRTREDTLRIMRDHVIGAYGAVALILLLIIKVTALGALIERGASARFLIIASVLSRWAIVPLGRFLPYARRESGGLGAAVTDHVGWLELAGATALAALLTFTLAGWRASVCWLAVIVVTAINGRMCRRRIGGVTGDTLGANTEMCEALVFLIALWL